MGYMREEKGSCNGGQEHWVLFQRTQAWCLARTWLLTTFSYSSLWRAPASTWYILHVHIHRQNTRTHKSHFKKSTVMYDIADVSRSVASSIYRHLMGHQLQTLQSVMLCVQNSSHGDAMGRSSLDSWPHPPHPHPWWENKLKLKVAWPVFFAELKV